MVVCASAMPDGINALSGLQATMMLEAYYQPLEKAQDQVNMSIVFVCSPAKLESVIADYQQSLDVEQVDHRIALLALVNFIENAEQARFFFHQETQIYSFTLDYFLDQLDQWCIQEQARWPDQKTRISLTANIIGQLFQSSWPVDTNLVVRELLTGTETYNPYP